MNAKMSANGIDDKQGSRGSAEIDPAEQQVGLFGDFPEGVKIEECRDNFDDEKHPFNGEAKDKDVNQGRCAVGTDQGDGKPDGHTG